MRPTADSARHISVPDLNSYAKGDNGAKVETMLMDNRRKAEKVLQDLVGEGASTRYLEKFEMNLISLLFAKKLDASSFDTTGCVGKYSEAKAEQMVVNWAKWLETRSEALKGFAEKVGIDINDGDDGKVAPLDVTMEAANFENHEFQASMNTECIAAGLVVGAHVKLARRITVDLLGGGEGRVDFVKGYATFIKGMANGLPVVNCAAMWKKVMRDKDVAVKASNLTILTDSEVAAAAAGKGGNDDESKKGCCQEGESGQRLRVLDQGIGRHRGHRH